MQNVLKRTKNPISDFFDFYFSSYGYFFYSKHIQFSMNFHQNSQKKSEFFSSYFIRFRMLLNYLDRKIKTALFEGGGSADHSLGNTQYIHIYIIYVYI